MASSIPPVPLHDGLQKRADVPDYISELPDDFLISVLSLLPLDDAARTGVLSKTWRYLWTHVPVLNFDGQKVLDELFLFRQSGDGEILERWRASLLEILLNEKTVWYVNWVNRVMEVSKAPVVESLRIRFDLDGRYDDQIDRWIRFAMEKQVETFNLNLMRYDVCHPTRRYSFDALHSTEMEDFSRWTSLRALELAGVDISGEVLEMILSSCLSLESLSVFGSKTLVNLKVSGAALKLKHLKLSVCPYLKNLEISAENLVSLHYSGSEIKLPFTYAPSLIETVFGGYCGDYVIRNMFLLSKYASKLFSLSLHSVSATENMELFECPVLDNLKELGLRAVAADNATLLGITSLIEKSPSLQKFSLKLSTHTFRPWESCFQRQLIKARRCIHRQIKVVEFVGFVGKVIDMELMMFFIENAVALEEIIIDIRNPSQTGTVYENKVHPDKKMTAMKGIDNLRIKIPSGVKLTTIIV